MLRRLPRAWPVPLWRSVRLRPFRLRLSWPASWASSRSLSAASICSRTSVALAALASLDALDDGLRECGDVSTGPVVGATHARASSIIFRICFSVHFVLAMTGIQFCLSVRRAVYNSNVLEFGLVVHDCIRVLRRSRTAWDRTRCSSRGGSSCGVAPGRCRRLGFRAVLPVTTSSIRESTRSSPPPLVRAMGRSLLCWTFRITSSLDTSPKAPGMNRSFSPHGSSATSP